MEEEKVNQLTEAIVGCPMKVSNTLSVGFLEKVYENALAVELRRAGLKVEQQKPISVLYEEVIVGAYIVDLLVEDLVLVELKVARVIDDVHQAQMLNYLEVSRQKIGLILNFGTSRLGIKRMIN